MSLLLLDQTIGNSYLEDAKTKTKTQHLFSYRLLVFSIGLEEARIRMDIFSFLLVRTKHELPFLAW